MRIVTTPDFLAQLKQLRKSYRQINRDLTALNELEHGPRPQDFRLPNIGVPDVYKARLPNRSARKGSSGGFRVVYRVKRDSVLLLLIWSKSQTADIPDSEISRVARRYG